jgi:hypothetical protein
LDEKQDECLQKAHAENVQNCRKVSDLPVSSPKFGTLFTISSEKIVCLLFCWRRYTAATECSLRLYSTAHPAPDTTLRCSACSRVKTCGSSKTVYLLALPSSVRSFCVTRTNGIRSVLKIFTGFQNSSYQIFGCCMQWTTTADRVCNAHFAKHNTESLSAISTSILIAV